MTDHLFVYGTLMRAASASPLGRDMRARLEREATWRGAATTAGRIHDLGSYPVLTPAGEPGEIVHGEAWQLGDADAVFRWLDPYEGIEAGRSVHEYARLVRRATLASGAAIDAWVYVYAGAVPASARRLADGRWRLPGG